MTLVAEPAPTVTRRGRFERIWSAPVGAHLLALALVLLALVPVVGTTASFSADEGAAIIQAQSLSQGEGWVVEHPVPEVDPTGRNYPLEFSERGPQGFAPFAKHPLYPLLLAGADRLGGVTAMVLLSLAGTLAAAGLAAGLARRLEPTLERPTVWAVGLASPLLFDGFLVMAHTLGAACATAAVLAAVTAVERRSPAVALGVVPCIGLSVLLRNEAVFFGLALAVTAGVLALRGAREARMAAGVVAAGSALAGIGAHLAERLWTRTVLGGGSISVRTAVESGQSGFLSGRIEGFELTWLTPSYFGPRLLDVGLLAMLAFIALGAFVARRHPEDRRPLLASAIGAAGAVLLALATKPANVVPGLLVAFPLAFAGFLLIGRRTLRSAAARLSFGTFALFALAVLATQYSRGGSGEWGGRYFALGLPAAVPVLLLALRDHRPRSRPVARVVATSLVVCSLALAVMGVSALRASHQFVGTLMATIEQAGREAAPAQPIMVTTSATISRLSWRTFDDQRWLLASPDDLRDVVERLRAAGQLRLAFVTDDLERDRPLLGNDVDVLSDERAAGGRSWSVLVLGLAPPGLAR